MVNGSFSLFVKKYHIKDMIINLRKKGKII